MMAHVLIGLVAASPFWGDLAPGSHQVGLRIETLSDAHGPAIQVVWVFPTVSEGPRWTLGALVDATCEEAGQPEPPLTRAACRSRYLEASATNQRAQRREQVLEWPLQSVRGATPLDERRPVILFDGGLRSDGLSYIALAEYLASHGYVCISLPSLPFERNKPLTFDETGIRAKAQQIARVSRLSAQLRGVDSAQTALAGWSVGGVSTVVAARQIRGVRALISLDGGLGYDYGPPIARAVLGAGPITSVPVLHVSGMAPNAHDVPKTFDVFETTPMTHAYRAEVDGINHSHFVMQGGAILFAGDRSPEAATFWRANSALSRIVLLFVQTFLGQRAPANGFLGRARQFEGDGARVVSFVTR